jgi:hypothetical protein
VQKALYSQIQSNARKKLNPAASRMDYNQAGQEDIRKMTQEFQNQYHGKHTPEQETQFYTQQLQNLNKQSPSQPPMQTPAAPQAAPTTPAPTPPPMPTGITRNADNVPKQPAAPGVSSASTGQAPQLGNTAKAMSSAKPKRAMSPYGYGV